MIEASKKGILLLGEGAPKNAELPSINKYYNEYFNDSKVSTNDSWLKAIKRNKLFLPKLIEERKWQFEKINFQDGIATHIAAEKIRKDLELDAKAPVFLANRYGEPSISDTLKEIKESSIEKILIIPLFPNYLPMTYDTSILKTFEIAGRDFPEVELHIIPPFYEHKDYIKPLEMMVRDQNTINKIEHLHFVYRGVKEEHISGSKCSFEGLADIEEENKQVNYCYQVKTTTDLLMDRINDLNIDHSLSFLPAKLGKGSYLTPNTIDTLKDLISKGTKNITLISPSTIIDNIETLYDIDIELREKFMEIGGESFTFIPSINDHPEWIEHLAKWADEWLFS
ncbi:MAG: ferrochelatase [Bacteroidota bacterium]